MTANPGQVLEASRLLEQKGTPARVAHRLIEQQLGNMEMDWDSEKRREKQEQDAFLLRMAAGHYTQALKRTGFQQQARRLVGASAAGKQKE